MKSITIRLSYQAIIGITIPIVLLLRQKLPVYPGIYIIYLIEGAVTKYVKQEKGSFLHSMRNRRDRT